MEQGLGTRLVRLHIADLEPLAGEVVDKGLRFRIGEHPHHLLLHHLGLMQRAFRRQVQQHVIRDAAPDEEGQPGCQVDVAQSIGRVRLHVRRLGFQSEEKLRAQQDTAEGHFDARLKAAYHGGRPKPPQRGFEVGLGHYRMTIGAARERRDDPLGARLVGRR